MQALSCREALMGDLFISVLIIAAGVAFIYFNIKYEDTDDDEET